MEQINQSNLVTDEAIITDNERWFNFFVILPKAASIFFAVVCFILGIVFSSIIENAIFLLVFWGGGIVFCAINYVILKLVLSYQILHIYYLKKISLNNNALESTKAKEPDVLPEI